MMPTDEFREKFDIPPLPEEETGEYETLGGFVMTMLGRVPSPGDHFEWHGLRFEVLDMDGHRVDKVLVAAVPPGSTKTADAPKAEVQAKGAG